MTNQNNNINKSIIFFEDVKIRRKWLEEKEKWYFAIVDIIQILTHSNRPRKYWSDLKKKLIEEGFIEVSAKIGQLKLMAYDGKMRKTDVADIETIFRIIQSIPSKKAEPFKRWLAKVGYERMQETADPEISINRARKNWKAYGMSQKWIEQRMRGQEIRNKLTDYWGESGVKKGIEYAQLTDIIHKEWSELTTAEHKELKGLEKENLRNNMSEAELLFTALAELSTPIL